MKWIIRGAAALLVCGGAAPSLDAQTLRFIPRTGGYGAIQLGQSSMEIACDSCAAGRQGASHAQLLLGAHFGSRMRLEAGLAMQNNREDDGMPLSSWSVGGAYYVVHNLHVRVALAWHSVSGNYTSQSGQGLTFGAGYDIPIVRRLHVSPYVNVVTGKIARLGTIETPTSGTVSALNYGVAIGGINRTYECTTSRGQVLRLKRSNVYQFRTCVEEYQRNLNSSAGGRG